MADDEQSQQPSRRWSAFVAAPVLYVLSVGPICWIGHALPDEWAWQIEVTLEKVYSPLIFAGGYSEWSQEVLDWYADLL